MTAKDDSSLEVEKEVLADRLDALEPPAVEATGNVQRSSARMWSLDLYALTHKPLQATSRAVDAVAFGHRMFSRRPSVRVHALGLGRTLSRLPSL